MDPAQALALLQLWMANAQWQEALANYRMAAMQAWPVGFHSAQCSPHSTQPTAYSSEGEEGAGDCSPHSFVDVVSVPNSADGTPTSLVNHSYSPPVSSPTTTQLDVLRTLAMLIASASTGSHHRCEQSQSAAVDTSAKDTGFGETGHLVSLIAQSEEE